MKPSNYFFLFLLLSFFHHSSVQAQDISGAWVGNYGKKLMMAQPQKIVVELFLHDDSLITGASHLYYRNNHYEHYTLAGKFNKKDSTVFFREDSTLGVKLGFGITNCLGNYSTRLSVSDTLLLLTGQWKDNSTSIFHCPSVSVQFKKPLPRKTSVMISKDRNLERASIIQHLVEIPIAEKDSIKIELFDNKEIDGDIISLYLNDSIILSKQMLTEKPLVLYVSLNQNEPVCKIKMAAESLGNEPPCTAMMIVTTSRGEKHSVNLSSNFSNNSVAELFLKE